jgi:hypothetical protein
MTIEYDDKGKFFTEVVKKIPVSVVIQTTAHLIRGMVHVREGERFKNELERDELFLAVTDARVFNADGTVLFNQPFMAIRRAQIIWIMPVNEEPQRDLDQ